MAISAGGLYHSLALKSDGSIVKWGYMPTFHWPPPEPPSGNDFTAVAAGDSHSVALKSNGTIVTWGDDYGEPPDGNNFIAIAAGGKHSLALRSNGSVEGWGQNNWGQSEDQGNTATSPIVERYSYDVYGKPTIKGPDGSTRTTSAFGNRFMFTGREYDSETGNYYYRARYYSPKIGRFLQTDPIGYVGGLNLYTYCVNNPVKWTDPWGLDIWVGSTGLFGWHNNFNVGDPKGDYSTYGYALKEPWFKNYNWPFWNPNFRRGYIYNDWAHRDARIARYYRTSPEVDRWIKQAMDQQLGEEGGYSPLSNCHQFSNLMFDEFREQFPEKTCRKKQAPYAIPTVQDPVDVTPSAS